MLRMENSLCQLTVNLSPSLVITSTLVSYFKLQNEAGQVCATVNLYETIYSNG